MDSESIIVINSEAVLKVALILLIDSSPKLDKGILKSITSPGFNAPSLLPFESSKLA